MVELFTLYFKALAVFSVLLAIESYIFDRLEAKYHETHIDRKRGRHNDKIR